MAWRANFYENLECTHFVLLPIGSLSLWRHFKRSPSFAFCYSMQSLSNEAKTKLLKISWKYLVYELNLLHRGLFWRFLFGKYFNEPTFHFSLWTFSMCVFSFPQYLQCLSSNLCTIVIWDLRPLRVDKFLPQWSQLNWFPLISMVLMFQWIKRY